MGQVDPDDDAIRRGWIYHYRFDPARNDRRNVVAAVYDNVVEFEVELHRYGESGPQ